MAPTASDAGAASRSGPSSLADPDASSGPSTAPRPRPHLGVDRVGPVAVWVAVVAGVAVRAWLASGAAVGRIDPDEAVSGLVARGVLHGHLPAFYWGQAYGGTVEEVLIAPWLALFGTTAGALRVAPTLLGLVGIWLTWRLGRRLLGDRSGRLAAALTAVWPLGNLYWSTRARGFYGVALVVVLSTTLLAVRLRDRPEAERRSRVDHRDWLLLGLGAGIGWWTSPLTAVVLVPVAVWLVAGRRPATADVARVAVAGATGALPWLVVNLTSGWSSLRTVPQGVVHNGYLDHLHGFAVRGVPLALGLQVPLEPGWLVLRPLGIALVAAAVGVVALRARRLPRSARLLGAVVLAYPLLLALTPYAFYFDDTRYLYLLHPFVALLVAGVAVRAGRWVGPALLVTALALTLAGLPGLQRHPAPDLDGLVAGLERHGIDRVAAGYRIAYPVAYLSDRRIVATPITGSDRSPAFARAVRSARRVGVVLGNGVASPRRIGDGHVLGRFEAGGYTVLVVDRPAAEVLVPRP